MFMHLPKHDPENYLGKEGNFFTFSAISYYTIYEYQTVNFSSFHKTFAPSITLKIPKCFMFNLTVYHTINFDFVFRVLPFPIHKYQYSWLYLLSSLCLLHILFVLLFKCSLFRVNFRFIINQTDR